MDHKKVQDDLSHIRQMMEKSSRFNSLSGISGVVAGMAALLGVCVVLFLIKPAEFFIPIKIPHYNYSSELIVSIAIGLAVLVIGVTGFFFLSYLRGKSSNTPLWTTAVKDLLLTSGTPLIAGGAVCLALLYHHLEIFLVPATLIFYGISLVNAGQYTHLELRTLGILQLILGCVALFIPELGFWLWAFGFGILHIIFGFLIHTKYKASQ